jgi:2,3-diketo-5-methylthio-1-phosphopentane phosphatase
VLVDFDGTIVPSDATDQLLETFADPSWEAIEADWKAGRIGSRECLSRQVALIRATPEDLDAKIATFEPDPGFADFVATCRRRGVTVSVLSDGLDRAVEGVLRRANLSLGYKANHLAYLGDRRWELRFPHQNPACVAASGNCKCATAMAAPVEDVIMVGDGRSDFCVSGRATFVLAKKALIRHCVENDLPHAAFEHFDQATLLLNAWLDGRTRRAAVAGRRRGDVPIAAGSRA